MIKINFLLLFLVLLNWSLAGQEYSTKFGQISKDEIDLQSYDTDPDAVAVKLFDKGQIRFVTGGFQGDYILFTRKTRIKVLKEGGITYGNLEIPFYVDNTRNRERVKSIVGISYNFEGGSVTKSEIDDSMIFEERVNKNWYQKKIAIPNVKAGSIIEISYVIESPFFFNMPTWRFQSKIPTHYSELKLYVVQKYDFQYIAQGIDKFDAHETKTTLNEVKNTFVMKKVPSFKDESYITSIDDYVMQLSFQLSQIKYKDGRVKKLSNTWEGLKKLYLSSDDFGKFLKKAKKESRGIIENAISINQLSATPTIQEIVTFCKNYFKWNKSYSRLASNTAKEVAKQRLANSTEISLFMIAMLQNQGYSARPVLISTRNHGKIAVEYPFTKFFNHTVVLFEEDQNLYITDGLSIHLPYNRMTPDSFNDFGLIMDKGEEKWIDLTMKFPSTETIRFNVTIDPDTKTASLMTVIQANEYKAYDWRSSFNDDKELLEGFLSESRLGEITDSQTRNYNDTNKPYRMVVKSEVELETLGDDIIINPFFGFPMNSNALTADERSYPIDFTYSFENEFHSVINFPEDYDVVIEENHIKIDDELVTIMLEFQSREKYIALTGYYWIKKSVYQPEDYHVLKAHLDTIVEEFNQQILLRKKK